MLGCRDSSLFFRSFVCLLRVSPMCKVSLPIILCAVYHAALTLRCSLLAPLLSHAVNDTHVTPVSSWCQLLQYQAGTTRRWPGRVCQHGAARPSPCGRVGGKNTGRLLEALQKACQSPGEIRRRVRDKGRPWLCLVNGVAFSCGCGCCFGTMLLVGCFCTMFRAATGRTSLVSCSVE